MLNMIIEAPVTSVIKCLLLNLHRYVAFWEFLHNNPVKKNGFVLKFTGLTCCTAVIASYMYSVTPQACQGWP